MGVTCGQSHLCLAVTIGAFSAVYSLTCSLDAQIYIHISIENVRILFLFIFLLFLLMYAVFCSLYRNVFILKIDICYISITILKETLHFV